MKKTSFKVFSLFILTTILAISCKVDDGDLLSVPETNIVEVASSTAELSTLVSALQRADLVTTLESSTLYTVLAPTNAAFTNFLGQAGFSTVDEVPVETLRQILLNHLVASRVDAAVLSNLQKNYVQTFADGPSSNSRLSLYFDATDGVVFNGSATVTKADILASNGLIHIVDQVIAIPTLDTFISTDDNFEDLDTALDVISPLTDLTDLLKESTAGPFTVFAPVNAAFDNLLDTNDDWNFISDIDETLLTSVLAHHVISGNIRAFDFQNSPTLPSLEGDGILVGQNAGLTQLTDGSGESDIIVRATDVQASNGVLHLIDKVMMPNTEN